MKIFHSINELPFIAHPVITMGNFDGVHLGHIHVFEHLVEHESSGYESVVITFWPHPRRVLQEGTGNLKFLTSVEEKTELIKKTGIKNLIIIPFSTEMAEMTAHQFVQNILIGRLGARKIILGYDHRFGKNREGGLDFLLENNALYNFELEEIPKKEIESIGISSSKIRQYLENGNVEDAKLLLGRNYALSGKVIEGNKLGRTIGFPTANINLTFSEKLIPKTGVYAIKAEVKNKVFNGMLNIGFRPTVEGKNLTIEANIFDFSEDIYGQEIKTELIKYLRPEEKFASVEKLKEQLARDKFTAITILDDK